MKLELGSGYLPTDGFVHLDINPDAPGVDIVGNAYGLPDEVHDRAPWDELRAVDVLEHISYRHTGHALSEWATLLRPGGRLYVQVPDADTIMRWYCASDPELKRRLPAGLPRSFLLGASWRLLGGHSDGVYAVGADDFRWNAHYSLWSVESLTHALAQAGFRVESIERNIHPNLLCWAVKR